MLSNLFQTRLFHVLRFVCSFLGPQNSHPEWDEDDETTSFPLAFLMCLPQGGRRPPSMQRAGNAGPVLQRLHVQVSVSGRFLFCVCKLRRLPQDCVLTPVQSSGVPEAALCLIIHQQDSQNSLESALLVIMVHYSKRTWIKISQGEGGGGRAEKGSKRGAPIYLLLGKCGWH